MVSDLALVPITWYGIYLHCCLLGVLQRRLFWKRPTNNAKRHPRPKTKSSRPSWPKWRVSPMLEKMFVSKFWRVIPMICTRRLRPTFRGSDGAGGGDFIYFFWLMMTGHGTYDTIAMSSLHAGQKADCFYQWRIEWNAFDWKISSIRQAIRLERVTHIDNIEMNYGRIFDLNSAVKDLYQRFLSWCGPIPM